MTIFNKFALGASLIALVASEAEATPMKPLNFDMSRYAYKAVRSGEKKASFPGRMAKVNQLNAMMAGTDSEQISPLVSFGSSDMIGDIDGPNNELWFYTSSMVYKNIQHEYYVEQILLEYMFDVYNASGELVGSIHDKMRYGENEVRTVDCSLVPVISKNFFNDDDHYEVIIGLGVNRTKVNDDGSTEWMPNTYRSMIYSLGGEKETLEVEDPVTGDMVTKEFDKPVYRMEGSLADVLDASVGDKEEFYMAFYDEVLPEYSDDDIISGDDGPVVSDSFWESLTSAHVTLKVCGKVDAQGNMPKLMSFDIPFLSMPGDQESTPFLISFRNGEDAYYLVQYYKDIFFNQYNSPMEDLTMREHNSLMIDLYKVSDGEVAKVNTTEVPFVKDSKDRLLFSFHSVGDFRYNEDINFNEDGSLASFFVTKNNYFADEHSEYSYYHYDKDGNKLNNIFENAESNMPMTNIEGMEPQQMFVTYTNGEYIFHFVDLLTGTPRASFSCYLEIDPDADPDMMTANIDRTKVGDSYQYAVEMRTPSVDENDNSIMRIGWLDDKGNFIRMDEVNMGQYVVYAQCYIDGYTLQKDFYLKDEPNEYMMLIKRGVDVSSTREDLLIGQALNPESPKGKDVLLLTADERGALSTINPYTMLEKPMLHVYYYDQESEKMSLDIYYMPFELSGIEEIGSDLSASSLTYDGISVFAQGGDIRVFDIQGRLLRQGIGSVRVDDLGKGIYVALANGEVRKFAVK
ncbi:MAG: hypothetical protein HDR88_13735 [Bacteroides sp.]|nr:hypothetical protein [Bacteroides sp.]